MVSFINFDEINARRKDEEARGIWFNSKTERYAWLSNFYNCEVPVHLDKTWLFPNVEAAYQFAKLPKPLRMNPLDWLFLSGMQAKAKGKTIPIRDDWEEKKIAIMALLVLRKFEHNKTLGTQLRLTKDVQLIHLSPWDLFWGCDELGRGANGLGEMLMKIREDI